MCIARVGKILSVSKGKARVEFFDGGKMEDVDVSVVGNTRRGSYVEVFGNLALSTLTPAEAERRRAAWAEVRRAASLPLVRSGRR